MKETELLRKECRFLLDDLLPASDFKIVKLFDEKVFNFICH